MKAHPAVIAVAAGLLVAEGANHAARHFAETWSPRRGDFQAYYWAGRRLDAGTLDDLYAADARDPSSERRIKDFKNLPLVGAAFAPFGRLEYDSAWKAWWVVSLLFCVAGGAVASLWLRRWCAAWPLAAAAAVSAALHCFPLLDAFELGQTTQAVTLLVLLGYLSLAGGRDVVAGVLLAVAAVVKIPVLLLGVVLVLSRRWRAALVFGATVGAALALSILLYGPDVHRDWFRDALGPHSGTALTALNNQSLVAQLARLWGGDPLHSYRPSPLPAALAAARWTVVAVVALAWIAVRRGLPPRAAMDLDFALGIALMPFVSPIFWIHYFLLSLVALLVLSRHAARAGPGTWLLRGTLAAAYLLAAWYPPPDATWYGRAPGFWTELLNGRFLYSSGFLAAACFIAAKGIRTTADPGSGRPG